MSLPATDNFNRADGPIGSNWTGAIHGFQIVSNATTGDTNGANNLVFWNADTFNADQKSEVTVTAIGNGQGPAVRCNATGGGNGYIVYAAGTVIQLYEFTNGTATLVHDYSSSIAAGDVLRIEAEGTTIRVYKNNVQVGTDITDSTHATGSAGLYSGSDTGSMDDWTGDNLGGATVSTRYRLRWRP